MIHKHTCDCPAEGFCPSCDIVGSYAAPPAPGVTLTDAERRAIKVAIHILRDRCDRTNASNLRGLLLRAAKEDGR